MNLPHILSAIRYCEGTQKIVNRPFRYLWNWCHSHFLQDQLGTISKTVTFLKGHHKQRITGIRARQKPWRKGTSYLLDRDASQSPRSLPFQFSGQGSISPCPHPPSLHSLCLLHRSWHLHQSSTWEQSLRKHEVLHFMQGTCLRKFVKKKYVPKSSGESNFKEKFLLWFEVALCPNLYHFLCYK